MTADWLWARVDDRLLHGQVLVAWLPYLKPHTVACVPAPETDTVFLRTLYRSVLPPKVDLWVGRAEQLVEAVEEGLLDPTQTLLVLARLGDAARLFQGGMLGAALNLGCMAPTEQISRLSSQVAVDAEDEALLQVMANESVRIVVQALPDEQPHIWPKDYA